MCDDRMGAGKVPELFGAMLAYIELVNREWHQRHKALIGTPNKC